MGQTLPKYYFSGEYADFYPLLSSLPHVEMAFRPGDLLWRPGEPMLRNFYFRSGFVQAYVDHEDGHRKILSFHGAGTIFPGVQRTDYKIEQSIVVKALTDVRAMAFERGAFYQHCLYCPPLMAQLCETQSAYINMLIYDAAHQRYNDTFLKLCNFLFLMARTGGENNPLVSMTQENIADTLGVGRNHVTKGLSRLRQEKIVRLGRRCVEILDVPALAAYCSMETQDFSCLTQS